MAAGALADLNLRPSVKKQEQAVSKIKLSLVVCFRDPSDSNETNKTEISLMKKM